MMLIALQNCHLPLMCPSIVASKGTVGPIGLWGDVRRMLSCAHVLTGFVDAAIGTPIYVPQEPCSRIILPRKGKTIWHLW